MKRIVVLGQTNVGKTLFTISFAEYLAMNDLTVTFQNRERGSYTRTLTLIEAKQLLVSDAKHYTKDIQSMVLNIPWGKGLKRFEILDTAGLTDGIHHSQEIRLAMAETLRCVRHANLVFHILDCEKIAHMDLLKGIGEIDYQIAQFGQLKEGYAILANKIDLPGAMDGLHKIKSEFPGNRIIAISALTKKGFKEVKAYAKQLT